MPVLLILILLLLGGLAGYLLARHVVFKEDGASGDLSRTAASWSEQASAKFEEAKTAVRDAVSGESGPASQGASRGGGTSGTTTSEARGAAGPAAAAAAHDDMKSGSSSSPAQTSADGPGPASGAAERGQSTPEPVVATVPDDPATASAQDDIEVEGSPPPRLDRPEGEPDDLKQIRGIGPGIERTLNDLGIWHFRQIADFTPDQTAWVNSHLKFKGRIEREEWVPQAKELAAGGGRSTQGESAPGSSPNGGGTTS